MKLTLATWDHDRCMPLHDGRVSVPGVGFESHMLPTGKLFPLAVQEARVDITEFRRLICLWQLVLQVMLNQMAPNSL